MCLEKDKDYNSDEDSINGSALILAKVEEIAEEIREKGGL